MNVPRLASSTPVLTLLIAVTCTGATRPILSQHAFPEARALAMGGAFTAAGTGPAAAFLNPATTALRQPLTLSAGAFGSPDYRSLGATLHTGVWGIGAGLNTLGDSYFESGGSQMCAVLGFGANVASAFGISDPRVQIGVGLAGKFLHSNQLPSFDAYPRKRIVDSAVDLDAGAIAEYRRESKPRAYGARNFVAARGGIATRNIFGAAIETYDYGSEGELSRSIRGGIAIESGLFPISSTAHGLKLLLVADAEGYEHGRSNAAVGFEVEAVRFLSFRVGQLNRAGSEDITTLGVGAGIEFAGHAGVRFDFASARTYGDGLGVDEEIHWFGRYTDLTSVTIWFYVP